MTAGRIRLVVLNLRMGGQVSMIRALVRQLRRRGADCELLLPDEARSASKADLAAYGDRSATARLGDALRLLRGLDRRLEVGDVLHLVLPSPAMASVARVAAVDPSRVVLQYEGAPTRLDAPHLRALRDDPLLVAPRLLFNHAGWSRLARGLPCYHLATTESLAEALRRIGFARVSCTPNLASTDEEGDDEAPLELGPGRWVAYVGHAHPVKGVDDLLAAFEQAAAARPELRLLFALSGDGDAGRLARRVARSPARERISLAGLVPVRRLLASVDALVLPFRSALTTTLYPSLLLEADLEGCPVVLSRLPELEPALRPGARALTTFPPGDVPALAEALRALPPRPTGPAEPFLRLPPAGERVDALLALYRSVAGGARDERS